MVYSLKRQEFEQNGFITLPFPEVLRKEMMNHIQAHIQQLGKRADTLEEAVVTISDEVWQHKMSRCFRIFPKNLSNQALKWAQENICSIFGTKASAVNVVLPEEARDNPQITEDHLAIYWRCVRPDKPDAGRPHRDASFWDLEFKEGYNPKIPFDFHYLKDCIKIWIPLYGCLPDTTLRVIPCSHAIEIPTTVEQTECGRRPSISPDWLKANQSQFMSPIALSQGSCILFDMNLVHMGPRHNQPTLRLSAEFNFITK